MSIIRACASQVAACAHNTRRKTDAESIHQLRTTIRRLRAALSIFRPIIGEPPASLVSGLHSLQSELGAAREWDVLIDDMLDTMPEQVVAQKRFGKIVKKAEAARRTRDKQARGALDGSWCDDLLLQLTAWTNRPSKTAGQLDRAQNGASRTIDDFAEKLWIARRRKVRKLAKRIDKLDPENLHRLRIRIKKLRYAVEFFHDMWPHRRVKECLAILTRLQDGLGMAHDAMVSSRLMINLEHGSARASVAMKLLLNDWAAACVEHERKRAARLLRKLHRFKSPASAF